MNSKFFIFNLCLIVLTLLGTPPIAPDVSGQEEEELVYLEEEPNIISPDALESRKKRKSLCQKHDGQYIAFYDQVFLVKGCERIPYESEDVYRLTRRGVKLVEVGNEVIAYIPEGDGRSGKEVTEKRSCEAFEKNYVTYSFGDIYFVEKCKKRVFQDWASYEAHRGALRSKQAAILSITWDEFVSLAEGEPMPSVIDKESKELLKFNETTEIIPISEACAGIEGRFVSYYSKVYRIESCRKRQLSDKRIETEFKDGRVRLVELTSEQWISLPDGPSIN